MNRPAGIDPPTSSPSDSAAPYNADSFAQIGVIEAWQKYDRILTWGEGQMASVEQRAGRMPRRSVRHRLIRGSTPVGP